MFNYFLLAEGGLQDDWITTLFPIARIVLFSIIVLLAILIVVTTLMQSNDADSTANVLGGVKESYYADNKGTSRDGKLKKTTVIAAIIIAVCVVLYFLSLFINKTPL